MKDFNIGDRMKLLEGEEVKRKFMPILPICVRLDGKSFHSFCKGLKRPFDKRLNDLMIDTTKFLVEESNALVGYTQSDEITLVIYSEDYKSQVYFNGRIQKIVSVLSSAATAFFNSKLSECLPEKANLLPKFDCRAWQVPNKVEAVNVLVWREQDATKNSISMAAQHYFSHKELQNKSGKEMQEMLFSREGINWNDYPAFFKRGSFVKRVKSVRKFTTDEIDKLPEKHEARSNPNLAVERSDIVICGLPPIAKIENRVEYIFDNAEIKIKKEEKEV